MWLSLWIGCAQHVSERACVAATAFKAHVYLLFPNLWIHLGEKKNKTKKNMPSPQSVIFIIYNWAHCGLKSVARLITLHARMCLRASAHDASYIWTESVWTCRSSSAGLIHLMWCTAAARGGLVSQLASNRSSNSCSKGTTVSCWLLSPLPLFYWGTVVPCCGEMSRGDRVRENYY